MSRSKLARKIKVTQWVIDSLEQRGAIPTRANYQKIIEFLGYDPAKKPSP